MSDSGAPASTRAAETASVRGVAFGWAKVAVSMTMPAISAAASAPSPQVERRPRAGPRAASTISHVAAASGSIQSASPAASFEAWWSMTTRGSRSNSSAWRAATAPIRSSEPQSETTSEVVVGRRVRVGPEAVDAGEEVVQRRDRVGADGVAPCRPAPRRAGRRRASRRACRRRGSRGRPPARGGRLGRRSTTASGTASSHGARSTSSAASARDGLVAARRPGPDAPLRAAAAARPAGPRTAAPRPRSPSWRQPGDRRRQRLADRARPRRASRPASMLVQQLEDPRAALGGVVELEVELRDPLEPQPLARARAGRTASPGRAPRSSPSRSAGWPMTLTQTLAWRRSGVVSTSVIVANPIRGSATSRATIDADLLPQQLVDPLGSLAHRGRCRVGRSAETRGSPSAR